MRLLQVRQVGGVPASVRQVSALPSHQVLQQRLPEISMVLPPALVPHDPLIRLNHLKGVSFLISMHTGSHSVISVTRLPYSVPRSHVSLAHGITKSGGVSNSTRRYLLHVVWHYFLSYSLSRTACLASWFIDVRPTSASHPFHCPYHFLLNHLS